MQSHQFLGSTQWPYILTTHWSVWYFGHVLEEQEVGLSAVLHSLIYCHVWWTGSVGGGETKSVSILGHSVAAAAEAQGEEVEGVPCHPLYPQAPS